MTAVAALGTLEGSDDEPAELSGIGPVSADVVRELVAGGADVDRVTVDPATGRYSDLEPMVRQGRVVVPPPDRPAGPDATGPPEPGLGVVDLPDPYRPSAPLADLVLLRDQTCRFPGCDRRAVRCDLDHVDPHGRSGRTRCDNLTALCRRHHRLKHEGGWTLVGDPDGTLVWTSPHGRTVESRPPRLPGTGDPPPPPPDPQAAASEDDPDPPF